MLCIYRVSTPRLDNQSQSNLQRDSHVSWTQRDEEKYQRANKVLSVFCFTAEQLALTGCMIHSRHNGCLTYRQITDIKSKLFGRSLTTMPRGSPLDIPTESFCYSGISRPCVVAAAQPARIPVYIGYVKNCLRQKTSTLLPRPTLRCASAVNVRVPRKCQTETITWRSKISPRFTRLLITVQ